MRHLFKALAMATVMSSSALAQTTLNGSALAMRSAGAASGSAWNLGGTGYVGTYIEVPAGGANVSFTLNAQHGATGAGIPHLNLVVADSKFSFDITSSTAGNYNASAFLPGGTYFVRTERDYVAPSLASTRSALVNSLSIGGASISNASNSTNALAAADTYIQNFRKGPATVALTGPGNIPLLPGTQVSVDLKRHAFNFGTAVPGNSNNNVGSYLGGGGTAQQTNYQQRLLQNFNAVVPENAGKWSNNEATRDVPTMQNVDTILDYAQANNLRARMHNLIWGSQQPSWVNTHLTNGSAGSLTALRSEVSERIDYYLGDGPGGFEEQASRIVEVDIYNESYHTGSAGGASTWWNRYTAAGIADIHREARDAISTAGATAKVFVNEYNVYADGGSQYATWYTNHIESLRNAGHTAGYGEVVDGIGTQYYVNPIGQNEQHDPARMMQILQNLSVQGLPIALTEFGVKAGSTASLSADRMEDSVRLLFGTPDATGFFMWGFHAENGGGNLFAPAAAFYNVNTANWNSWTITEAGMRWQDLLGIQDWDGDPNNAWDTNLLATVNPDGTINFNGFWGDYSIANQIGFSNLNLAKGTSGYALSLAAPPGWFFWNANNSGNWSAGSNWTNGIAGGVGQTAHFAAAAAPRNVNVDSPVTVGMINFDSANSYTLSGPATITMDGPAGVVALNVVAGSHTIAAPVEVHDDLHVMVRDASSALSITGAIDAPAHAIDKSGQGAFNVARASAAALNVTAGTVRISPKASPADPIGTSVVRSLIVSAGRVDLTNNAMIVDYESAEAEPFDTIRGYVTSGFAAGAWTGDGIISSLADATTHGVGYAEASDLFSTFPATFAGQSVDDTSVLLRFTRFGDANLSGNVDLDDFNRLASSFNATGLWSDGDFTYDGDVNLDDFNVLAANFGLSAGADGVVDPEDWAALASAIPEPSCVVLVGVPTLVGMHLRRRRTCK